MIIMQVTELDRRSSIDAERVLSGELPATRFGLGSGDLDMPTARNAAIKEAIADNVAAARQQRWDNTKARLDRGRASYVRRRNAGFALGTALVVTGLVYAGGGVGEPQPVSRDKSSIVTTAISPRLPISVSMPPHR